MATVALAKHARVADVSGASSPPTSKKLSPPLSLSVSLYVVVNSILPFTKYEGLPVINKYVKGTVEAIVKLYTHSLDYN